MMGLCRWGAAAWTALVVIDSTGGLSVELRLVIVVAGWMERDLRHSIVMWPRGSPDI